MCNYLHVVPWCQLSHRAVYTCVYTPVQLSWYGIAAVVPGTIIVIPTKLVPVRPDRFDNLLKIPFWPFLCEKRLSNTRDKRALRSKRRLCSSGDCLLRTWHSPTLKLMWNWSRCSGVSRRKRCLKNYSRISYDFELLDLSEAHDPVSTGAVCTAVQVWEALLGRFLNNKNNPEQNT